MLDQLWHLSLAQRLSRMIALWSLKQHAVSASLVALIVYDIDIKLLNKFLRLLFSWTVREAAMSVASHSERFDDRQSLRLRHADFHDDISLPPSSLPNTSTEQTHQTANMFDLVLPIVQKLNVLFEILCSRSVETTHSRVIAVDGFDQRTIHLLIEYLHDSFKTRSQHFVRVCSTVFVNNFNTNLRDYSSLIRHWDALWKHFLHVSFSTDFINAEASHVQQSYALSSSASLSTALMNESICVNLISFSSLTVTYKVASKMSASDSYIEHNLLRYLTEHWRDMIRSNITISIHKYDETLKNKDVTRIDDENTQTLLVVADDLARDADDPFTSKQLRRIIFEIEKWLKEDWSTWLSL